MKVKIKKLDGTGRELELVVAPDKVKEASAAVVKDIQREAVMPGFRKGRVPDELVRKNFQKDIDDEVKKRVFPSAYQSALDDNKLVPVSFPEVAEAAFQPDGALRFTARFDTQPVVKLGKYKEIKLTGAKVGVTDSEVEGALSSVRGIYAEYADVTRPVQKGDYGVCKVTAHIDGQEIMKKKEKVIMADKEGSMMGMGEDLVGMKKGDTKTVNVTLPESYPDKKFAGKKADFTLELDEVKEKKLPDMNDDLAKKAGKETLEALRLEIREHILKQKEAENKNSMRRQVSEYLLSKNSFDLPGTMVARQLDVLVEKAEKDLAGKGVDESIVKENRDKLRQELRKDAENKIKLYFILHEIARLENIEATNDEVAGWLAEIAKYYNQKVEDVEKYYREHDLLGGISEQIREDKTMEFLVSVANIGTQNLQ